jgi:uncharacterized low-complexity protein
MSKKNVTPLAAAIGTAFALSIAAAPASADVNPFGMTDLSAGYQQVAEGKCGEGKCGAQKKAEKKGTEGKCGGAKEMEKNMEGNCGGKPAAAEGKCGEGKCGAQQKAVKKGMEEGKCGGSPKNMGEGKCGGK